MDDAMAVRSEEITQHHNKKEQTRELYYDAITVLTGYNTRYPWVA